VALVPFFSRRKRQASGTTDVYQYKNCPTKLRYQIVQMLDEANDRLPTNYETHDIYPDLVKVMRKELGVPRLSNEYEWKAEFQLWFLNHQVIDDLLDALEAATMLLSFVAKKTHRVAIVDDFVRELNARMLEAGFGFQMEGVQIVQISTQFLHSEVVVPALRLLGDPKYSAADAEFRQAHAEFRAGEYEDCIHDCGNALESVLKVILNEKGWAFDANDTASKLIAAAFTNGLIPTYMQTEFAGLRTILESGTPTVRNKSGGHGAGTNPRKIPVHIAAFQLHQTAAALQLLIEAAK